MIKRFSILLCIIILVGCASTDPTATQGQSTYDPSQRAEVDEDMESVDPDEPTDTDEMSTIMVRFYYHDPELDPDFILSPEAYLYISEEMQDPFNSEEFSGLMYEHTGIHVIAAWFEGNKLYVDLDEIELTYFNQGTTGSADRGIRLDKTLASVPNITSFEVFVGGERGAETEHFIFGYVGIVENNQFVDREFFDELD